MTIELPEWCTGLRDHQIIAVDEIVQKFKAGADLVVLDAPTGSGKTLIAEMVRQRMGFDLTAYVCSSLTLQDQFEEDYKYAAVAKGRDNYRVGDGRQTASDCTGVGCRLCVSREDCPYLMAREAAEQDPLACVNSTYWLLNANHRAHVWRKDFVVIDECDVFPSEVAKFNEIRIPGKWIRRAGMEPPGKGAHKRTIRIWLRKWMEATNQIIRDLDEKDRRRLGGIRATVKRVMDDEWVRAYDERGGLVLKPVWVSDRGEQIIWSHGDKWLLMSGSVVDPKGLVEDELGFTGTWDQVVVPMTYPEENRLIVFDRSTAVDMSYRNRAVGWDQMVDKVQEVVDRHVGENILVHTVSYPLANHLHRKVRAKNKWMYDSARTRAGVLEGFKAKGGVMFAPSMDRGVDFPDDECRVVVVAKVPYPNLKDPVISQKLHSGLRGKLWYKVQAIRGLLQMTGRHVRGPEDYGVTYVLDSGFAQLFRERALFPRWWRRAVRHVLDI